VEGTSAAQGRDMAIYPLSIYLSIVYINIHTRISIDIYRLIDMYVCIYLFIYISALSQAGELQDVEVKTEASLVSLQQELALAEHTYIYIYMCVYALHIHIHIHVYIYIYIYIPPPAFRLASCNKRRSIQRRVYIFIYIYIYI